MNEQRPSVLRRLFGGFWRFVDAMRRTVFNLIFLFIVIVILAAILRGGGKPLQERTALVLDLRGDLVEQHAGSASELLMANVRGESRRDVQLRDVLTVLDAAATDPKITSVVLMPDELTGGGLAALHEVTLALDRVKAAGKPVIAWSGSYDQRQFILAAHASEVYLHPMGAVYLKGFGGYRNYYKDALDKLGVTVNLLRVGTYKSYGEPFISNAPSPAAQEADAYLYNALWTDVQGDLEQQRKLEPGTIARTIENLPKLMTEVNGDVAKLVWRAKLVDGLKTRDELRALMMRRGATDPETHSFRQIGFDAYLARQRPALLGDAVGVVVAQGSISDGTAEPGNIGGVSTANLIRQAREDERIKAVVLRVDSPGGSPYGSELIRRELELTRAAGKPVIVSMGSVAASGGYWITMAADEVIADRDTITGSIGVFALLPTADKLGDKLGIHTGGTMTTWLAGAYDPLRPLDPRFEQVVQASINHVYEEFTTRAAQARKMSPEQIDAVGQGRVWTGTQAKERHLVDRIGSYRDALNAAATRAHLAAGYRVAYIETEASAVDRLLRSFGMSAATALKVELRLGLASAPVPAALADQATRDLAFVSEMTRNRSPFTAAVHCMCALPLIHL
jgi:protease-4